ncbi:MAG: insulinase family protein [Acidobacteria bacterium]|nr:insulinase family protein [Acidobacteriota bacterium]
MRTSIVVATATLLLGAGLPARAEKQSPPEPGTPKSFQVPTPERFHLDNDLAVTFVAYGTIPKARVLLVVDVGNANEASTQVWLADVTGDLLIEGSKSRSALEISQAAARMGGSLEIAVGAETTQLGGAVLSEFAPEMVRLVADVVRHPAFPESELARIKNDRNRQLSIARSQSQQLAVEKFRAVLYGEKHPFGRVFPTPEMIEGYSLKDVRGFYESGFGPKRARLYVVGRFDPDAVRVAVQEAFGDWAGANPVRIEDPSPRTTRSLTIVDRPGAVQTTLVLGLPVPDPSDPGYVKLAVTNSLLGGYFSSRITTNIREDKGYTYSPISQISSRRGDAYWVENADVSTEVTAPALKEILFEIDRLRSEPPSKEELAGVQSYMAGVFVLRNSSRTGIITQLEFLERHGLPDDYLRRYVDEVLAVTPADVREAAARYIRDDEMTIVAVGDRKAIEGELARVAGVEPKK